MQVSVTFRHMDPTDALKSFAADKVEKIEKIVHAPTDAHVVLSVEKYMHKADITIKANNGMLMRGQEKSEDMYASIDKAMAKIERQVRRYQEKLHHHKPRHGLSAKVLLNVMQSPTMDAKDMTETAKPEPEKPVVVVETKEIDAKPMSVDEAVMQMDLLHNDFLVFLNQDTGAFSVLTRREEGTFGLIEAPK